MILIFILSIIIFACTKNPSSADEKVIVSGKVSLAGQTEYGGVKISLYKPVAVDTALLRLNTQYPAIGLKITPEMLFNHFKETVQYSTTSDAAGNWQIKEVNKGIYNVVAEKDSFGFRYYFNKPAAGGIDLGELEKAVYLNGVLGSDLDLSGEYVILNNVTIPPGVLFSINGNSYVQLEENGRVQISGSLMLSGEEGQEIRLFGDGGQTWSTIENEIGATLGMHRVIITGSRNGIYNKSKNLYIDNSLFVKNDIGVENFNLSDTLEIMKCVFIMNGTAIKNTKVSNSKLISNAYLYNSNSIDILSSRNNYFEKNIFYEDSISIRINTGGFGTNFSEAYFTKNLMQRPYIGIYFLEGTAITAEFNNFLEPELYFIDAPGLLGSVIDTLYFTDNYWGLFTENQIKQKIFDMDDFLKPGYGYWIYVRSYLLDPVDIN